MSFLSDLAPEAASRVLSVVALGALATAAAGAGTAVVLTGSTSPSDWEVAYQHSQECHQVLAADDPSCSPAAARAIAEKELAAQLEREAEKLQTPSAATPAAAPSDSGPAAAPPATLPPAPAAPAPAHSDDSGEGNDG